MIVVSPRGRSFCGSISGHNQILYSFIPSCILLLKYCPDPPMSIVLPATTHAPDSEKFHLSQSLLFPHHIPCLEDMRRDLESFIMEINILKDRVERTHALYVTYHEDTEEQLLSKQIYYDHIRHLQKEFMSLLGYVRNGHKVKYTEEERSDPNKIFSLVGHFDFCHDGFENKVEDDSTICRRFLEFCPLKLTYSPSVVTDEPHLTVNGLLLMVHRIFAVSKEMARSYWENQLNVVLDHESDDSTPWNPIMNASNFERTMLNMP